MLKGFSLNTKHQEDYLKRWLEKNAPKEGDVLVMFGYGNGMYADAIEKSGCQGHTIIFEPVHKYEYEINYVRKIEDFKSNRRIDIVYSEFNEKALNNYLYNRLSDKLTSELIPAIYPNYHIVFADMCAKFLEIVDEATDMVRAGKNVNNRFNSAIESNININLKRLDKSLSLYAFLGNIPKDIPVIIAASGPSLSKNIQELKKAKGKSFIIGLDSSLPALLKENIIPDLYVSIDPTKIAKHFEDERIKDIPVALVLQSPEYVIKEEQKFFFFFNGDEEILPELKKQGINCITVPPLGSVANSAFSLVNIIGFKTIIFVGQDLAYTDDKYHADNTVHNEKEYKKDTVIYMQGIDGTDVKSSREFRMYKTGFEKIIEMYPQNTFIDATEGGAYINGTKVTTLMEAIDCYCKKDINISNYLEGVPLLINNN